jgi:hypothetical protein
MKVERDDEILYLVERFIGYVQPWHGHTLLLTSVQTTPNRKWSGVLGKMGKLGYTRVNMVSRE